jgi:hypothetical protein
VSLATALTELGLQRRLTWQEVEQLLHQVDVDVDQAVADVEFDAWWNGHILATRQRTAAIESLDRMLRPGGGGRG